MDAYLHEDLKLLKLRATNGPAEWRGRYNYQDMKNLNKEIKDVVGYQRHSWNEGVFYISFRDFVQFFEIVNICHFRESHCLSSIEDVVCSHNQVSYYQFYIRDQQGKN